MRGQRIADRYRLEEQVGSGGMGVVWRATDEELGRVVALKRAHVPGSPRNEQEMRREARMAAGVLHPNVVTLFDLVADDAERWLVMEYVPSRSLADLITENGPLPIYQVAAIGTQVAAALGAVHAKGVLHRDIKPGNVLVTADGTAKLVDFGVSRAGWGELTVVDTPVVAGTPAYLAPEVADGNEPTTASDVFSLGATLYAAVEGVSPFGTATNPLAMLRRVAAGEVTAPRRAGPLAPVLGAVLNRNPVARPGPEWLRAGLRGFVGAGTEDTGWITARSAAGAPRTAAGRSRRPLLAGLAGATLLMMVAVLLVALRGQGGSVTGEAVAAAGAPGPMLTVGDPHTIDPCGLVNAGPLGRYGLTRIDPDFGGFGRCDVLITVGGGDGEDDGQGDNDVDATVEFLGPEDRPSEQGGVFRQVGALRVLSVPPQRNVCERYILLPDGNVVDVDVDQERYLTDMCPIADTMTDGVLRVLTQTGIPRRATPLAVNTLARVDACSLLDDRALARLPGNDAARTLRGFGGWSCGWESEGSGVSVDLSYDQDGEFAADDDFGTPTRLGGHRAFTKPNDDGEDCTARVQGRKYVDAVGQDTYEILLVEVNGPQSNKQLCRVAADMGGAAAARMPPQ